MINVLQLHPPQLILITTCKHACQTPRTLSSSGYGHSPVTLKSDGGLHLHTSLIPFCFFIKTPTKNTPHPPQKSGENVLKKRVTVFFMEQLGTHLQMVDCQRIVSVANRFTHNTEASPSPENRHYGVNPSSSSCLFSVCFFLFIIITSVLNFAISQLNFWFTHFFFLLETFLKIKECFFFFLYSEFAPK